MNDNQIATTSPFVTSQPGLVPPLVTTKYVTHDQGNSSPRFIRSSMYNVPFTADMMKQASVPFALILSPFARTVEGEIIPPIVDFGEMGPIRCIRCKAYMCPNMQFIDAGRRFQCLLCRVTTEGKILVLSLQQIHKFFVFFFFDQKSRRNILSIWIILANVKINTNDQNWCLERMNLLQPKITAG